ncbi:MAG: pyridoxamine 5'-phosphate oxidase family protein [Thermomicrobiales bacterium]|nr:pyridoxamine 5'-phosphate oxidase family protein [Thermomicrobiales bacterium]
MSEETNQEWRGKVGKLSDEEMNEFLSTDVLCRLGVLDDEGWPYVVPVWFLYKDGGFYRPASGPIGPSSGKRQSGSISTSTSQAHPSQGAGEG